MEAWQTITGEKSFIGLALKNVSSFGIWYSRRIRVCAKEVDQFSHILRGVNHFKFYTNKIIMQWGSELQTSE